MNLFLFLPVWAFLWYLPIPPKKTGWKKPSRIITLLIGLLLFLIIQHFGTPLSVFVYLLVFLRLFAALIESAFSLRRVNFEDSTTRYYPYSRFPWRISARTRGKVIAAVFILFFIAAFMMVGFGQIQRVTNAAYFNSYIVPSAGLPFNTTIPDNMVRLVTDELAISIARRHMSEFGSNTQVLGCHITKTSNGKLGWIAVIGSTNVIAENYVKGFVIVDATDPTATPTILNNEFAVGEGLWWDHNIQFRSYIGDMEKSYGVAYVTWDLTTNETVYVVTRYNLGFDLVRRYETPMVYDSQGNPYQQANNLSDVPYWITQIYDENWLEEMTDEMGNLRRGQGFDYWAGGFLWIIPPSRERFEMTEDTRYIVDPETNDIVALICVNPVGNQRTLSGVFKATRNGIFFYDLTQANYISGMTAEDLVEGRLPKPATGIYDAEMPLLYPVETSPNNYRLAWYVPIYWREGTGEADETIYLAGFAIVDAAEASRITITMNGEGLTSEQLVRETRLDFMKLFGAVTYLQLNATVLGKYDYVQEGTTHIVLRLDNETYPWVEATPEDLATLQWNELMATVPTQNVSMYIEARGEHWIITYFDNLNI
ncbi:MAG TPA: hypothetical protein VIH48_04990 [Candidatus Bathyarchaeia archaeon]